MPTTTLLTQIAIPPGTIKAFGGTTVPSGFLPCDGSAVSRSTYSSLFAAIGTIHGQGDGVTTFNLPDSRGKFLRGYVPSALNTITGSGTASSNNATFSGHGLNRTGIKVQLASGTLSGLSASTTYYAIVVDSNTLAFATSLANALAGTKVAISGANSGVLTQWEDPDAASRAAGTVGGASSGVGSGQDHQFGSHKHGSVGSMNVLQQSSSYSCPSTNVVNGSIDSLLNGGNETRPQNLAVNYIIKI